MALNQMSSPEKGEGGAKRRVGVNRFDHTRAKTARARTLRKDATPAETKLWSHLRNGNMHGVSFRRQHPVGSYVLDFFCSAAMLAIELDGGQHSDAPNAERDAFRDTWFAQKGIKTIRFWNHQVLTDIDNVLDHIWFAVDERVRGRSTPTPALPLSGGGKKKGRSV
jgi:very-short-patch-repair endonuclease